MAKKLDDTKQKTNEVRPKKERPAQEGEEGARAGEEEEWKEYSEPVKDYTGLKIQVLQGGPTAEAQAAAEEAAPEQGRVKGPWNKPQPQQQPAAPEPEPEKPKEVKPASTAYVPPVARQQPRVEPRRHANKHAPDIHSDDSFPVLGATAALRREGAGWSTAAGGTPQQHSAGLRQPLALGNRFTELQHDS